MRRPDRTIAVPDHNVPTDDRSEPFADPLSQQQIEALRANCAEFGVPLFDVADVQSGENIVTMNIEIGATALGDGGRRGSFRTGNDTPRSVLHEHAPRMDR